ncbi:GLUG motif-containing protein [Natronobeatus ordinarius]|uniref:GLUG motif-containing protein n=1 Tax=Natronobeatus ordinarius TaxID=2963433 RepID=UPI0020CD7F6B|nr:GLUG motif-containing protein [Natronobeatus ordinarius]
MNDRTPDITRALGFTAAIVTVLALVAVGLTVAPGVVVADEADGAPDPDDYEDILEHMAGDGSADDPYVVTNVTELQAVAGDLEADYVLGADVDASATATWNGGDGFSPIGDEDERFAGTFDGDGHTIEGLTIDRSESFLVGLFGVTEGTVERVGLESVSIEGDSRVGALAGYHDHDGEVRESYATGTVTGNGDRVGGLVGENYADVDQSYATGTVTGQSFWVGGLIGRNFGNVDQSYATGTVTGNGTEFGGLIGGNFGNVDQSYATGTVTGNGTDSGGLIGGNFGNVDQSYATGTVTGNGTDFGGLIGRHEIGHVTDSYWDRETTGQHSSSGVPDRYGLTTYEMTGSEATANMNLSFPGTWDVIDEGTVVSYPFLSQNPQEPAPGYEERFAGGDGSEATPYEIETWHHLENARYELEANYTLIGDLDSETDGYDDIASENADDGAGFDPIGSDGSTPFEGAFDGNGYVIDGLYIDREDEFNVGLFGANEGTIRNVTMEAVTVTGEAFVGGLVGRNEGTVEASTADATVIGDDYVGGVTGVNAEGGEILESTSSGLVFSEVKVAGGLVGHNEESTIEESYTSAIVFGEEHAGGLVGSNVDGTVTHTYATGDVSGTESVGGAVAVNNGTIESSYSIGSVSGGDPVGGFAGENDGSLEGVYWDGETVDNPSLDGVGLGDDGATELDTAQLTGENATDNAEGLDFNAPSTWATIPDDYPTLAWEVDIIGVTSLDPEETTVDAGDAVPVTATVENPEPLEITSTVELRLEDDSVATTEVELGLIENETITFDGEDAIDTDGLEGEYTYTVATDTDQASGTLTVGPGSGEPQLGEYTNDDDVVETDGLRDAIDDWRSGVIDTDLLRDVIDAWRSGDPVD